MWPEKKKNKKAENASRKTLERTARPLYIFFVRFVNSSAVTLASWTNTWTNTKSSVLSEGMGWREGRVVQEGVVTDHYKRYDDLYSIDR